MGADVWGPPPDPWRAAASARPGAPRPPARGGLHRAGLETGSVTPQEPRRAKQAPTKIYLFYLNLVRGPGGPRRPCQHLLAHQAQGPALGGHWQVPLVEEHISLIPLVTWHAHSLATCPPRGPALCRHRGAWREQALPMKMPRACWAHGCMGAADFARQQGGVWAVGQALSESSVGMWLAHVGFRV